MPRPGTARCPACGSRTRCWGRDLHPAGSLGGNPPFTCDNTGEPLAGRLRKGSAGSNTAADHRAVLDAANAALPSAFRRRLMVTRDGAGAGQPLITRLDEVASRRGYQLTYSAGWERGERERAEDRSAFDPGGDINDGPGLAQREFCCTP